MLLKKKENKGNMGLSEDKYPVTDFNTRLPDSSISVADPLMAEYYTHRSPIYDALIDDLLKNNAVDEANDKALDVLIDVESEEESRRQGVSKVNKYENLDRLTAKRCGTIVEVERARDLLNQGIVEAKKTIDGLESRMEELGEIPDPIRVSSKDMSPLYRTDGKDGCVRFTFVNKMINGVRTSISFFTKPTITLIASLMVTLVDVTLFYIMFSSFLYDNPLLIGIMVAGLAFLQDFVPNIWAVQEKQKRQGFKIDSFILWFLRSTVIIGLLVSAVFTFPTRNLVLPDFFGDLGYIPLAYAFGRFLLNVGCSLGNFAIGYVSCNPLKTIYYNTMNYYYWCYENLGHIEAIVAEIEADPNYYERNKAYIDEKCRLIEENTKLWREKYKWYVRKRIAEHLGDPAATTYLTEYEYASPSKDHNTTSLNTVITNADSTAVPLKKGVPEREVA